MNVMDCQSGYSYHQRDKQSCEVVYVIENFRQLFSKHRVSKIASSVWWRVVQTEKNVVCCAVEYLMPALHRTMCE